MDYFILFPIGPCEDLSCGVHIVICIIYFITSEAGDQGRGLKRFYVLSRKELPFIKHLSLGTGDEIFATVVDNSILMHQTLVVMNDVTDIYFNGCSQREMLICGRVMYLI